MKKLFTSTSLFIFVIMLTAAFTGSVSAQQTVVVNYDFASAVAGTPCTATPLTMASGVTSTFTTGGTGGGTCTTPAGTAVASPPAFVANSLNQSVSLTSFAAGSTNYFQFQLSGVTNFKDYMLFFQSLRSGTGPVNLDVQYSTNGTTFTTFQTINPGNGAVASFNIDLSAVPAIENQPNVFFRLLGRDGTGSTGTLRIDNFQVAATSTLAPTAATVNVGGRVVNSSGRALARARITLTDGSGIVRTATTNPSGYYRFADVAAGQTIILNGVAKGYMFTQPTQVVSLDSDAVNVNFTAYPSSDSVK